MGSQVAFSIYPLSRFEQSGQTTIRRPREFLCFSYDDKYNIKFSDESLRYFYPPFFHAPGTHISSINLSKGFDKWIKADDSLDNHLDGLLQTIQKHEESIMNDGAAFEEVRTKADFITWRGMMTKIVTAPFDIFSDFEMNATCYQGTIFIEENHAYKMLEEDNRRPPKQGEASQQMMQYWGYKFEAVSVLNKPWAQCTREEIDSREDSVVNNIAQYCSIARTGIGNHSLIIAGEVDCVMGRKPSNLDRPIPWVELKTTADIPMHNSRERQKFERKLLKFWAQSFLLGVPTIVVGYRSPDGYLTRVEELETQKIPGIVARGEGTWSGNICINLASAFLDFLKDTIMGQDGVWRIKRSKNGNDIVVFRIAETGTGEILRPAFREHREKLLAAEIAQKLGGSTIS